MSVFVIFLISCGSDGAGTSPGSSSSSSSGSGGAGGQASSSSSSGEGGSGGVIGPGPTCVDPPTVNNGVTAVLAPEFAALYRIFNIGGIPGIPEDEWFGIPLVDAKDTTTMYFAARNLNDPTTMPSVPFYSVKLKRDECGHIIGFAGDATSLGTIESVSGSLVYGPGGNLVWDQFPINSIGQSTAPTAGNYMSTPFPQVGSLNHGVSSIAFVPPGLAGEGQLLGAEFKSGDFYHFDVALGSPFVTFSNPKVTVSLGLNQGPAGFAYIPAGSAGFPKQSLMVDLWYQNKIVVFDVDDQGDPVVASQRDFFSKFDLPWGSYFDSITGDFVLIRHPDKSKNLPASLVLVQGFVPPPPPPK